MAVFDAPEVVGGGGGSGYAQCDRHIRIHVTSGMGSCQREGLKGGESSYNEYHAGWRGSESLCHSPVRAGSPFTLPHRCTRSLSLSLSARPLFPDEGAAKTEWQIRILSVSVQMLAGPHSKGRHSGWVAEYEITGVGQYQALLLTSFLGKARVPQRELQINCEAYFSSLKGGKAERKRKTRFRGGRGYVTSLFISGLQNHTAAKKTKSRVGEKLL